METHRVLVSVSNSYRAELRLGHREPVQVRSFCISAHVLISMIAGESRVTEVNLSVDCLTFAVQPEAVGGVRP